MRLTLARPSTPDTDAQPARALYDQIWLRALAGPLAALPADGPRTAHSLLCSAVPHLAQLTGAAQRRVFYVRLLADVHAPEAKLVSNDLAESGDALVALLLAALEAHGEAVGYDPERWRWTARDIAIKKAERLRSPAVDPLALLLDAGQALARAIQVLDGDDGAVPERIAAALGNVTAVLAWGR